MRIVFMIKTELINNYLKENKLSKSKFCEPCKIYPSTLKRILNNENVSLISVFKVSKVLKVKIHQMFY